MTTRVEIVEYEWAGKWGPFKIKTECAECGLTKAIVEDMLKKEFKGKRVSFRQEPWLDHFLTVLFKGAYHPPIIMVNGKKFHQFSEKDPLVDREKLKGHVYRLLENESQNA